MPDIPLFLLAAVLLTLAPGPDNIQVLMRGMAQGRAAAFVATCGFVSGVVVHTALAVFGVALVIRSSPILFALLKFAGAGYLLYLGYRTLRHPDFLMPANSEGKANLGAVFRQCFMGNVLNPKVSLFFLSFLPQFLNMPAGHVETQMLILGAVFMAQAFVIFATIGWFAASLGAWLRQSKRFGRWLNTAAGLTFVGIGIKLAMAEGH
ncbi:MAG: LysE family translocator [Rhodocyclaceae bacterium]|nr:MAG: LysE family translocator [Rhodocyclaceae bacterium]